MRPALTLPPLPLILLLWLAGLGAAGQFAKIAVPFDLVRQLYPDAGAGQGWLLSVISLCGILFGMVAGLLTARYGCRRLLVAGLALGALMSLWQATQPAFALMLASRMIEGLSHLAIVVAAPTLIAQIAPEPLRNFAMTLWSTFFGVAFALVAWIGLPWAQTHGVAGLFLCHGGVMAMLAVAVWCLLPADETATDAETSLRPRDLLARHLSAYGSPRIAAPAVGWLFYTLTFVSLVAILPPLLPENLRATIVGVMPLTSIAVALLVVTPLLRRWPAIGVVIAGFGLSALVLSGYWLGVATPVLCVMLFATLGLVQGASFAAIPALNATAQDRALANGALAQMGNLGNTLGTPLLLLVLAGWGTGALLAAVIVIYLAGISLHLWLWRRRRRE